MGKNADSRATSSVELREVQSQTGGARKLGRVPKSLGRVFNFKLGCFAS